MGNTVFYQEVNKNPSKITWKQILSNSGRKHTPSELEYAMTAGMSFNSATEEDMLKKWHKPWVFLNVLKIGWVLIAVIFLCYIVLNATGLMIPAIQLLTMMIPPMVVPITVMIFIWELNIPKNLSIIQVFGCFVIGGTVSIVLSMLGFLLMAVLGISSTFAPMAAFAEEPGKLLAALLCISYFQRKHGTKMYAVTAATIAAAVGSGFSAFESAQYMLNGEMANGLFGGIGMFLQWRLLGSIGSHTLYCAICVTALALCAKGKKITGGCFGKPLFWAGLACSIGLHFLWNLSGYLVSGMAMMIVLELVFLALQWIAFLWILKKALNQVISSGKYVSGTAVGYEPEIASRTARRDSLPTIAVTGTAGVFSGKKWESAAAAQLNFGRSSECQIQFPQDTTGISRQHCSIYEKDGAWVIGDLNSTYGTFVNNQKLPAGQELRLANNDQIMLGGIEQVFKITFV